MDQIIKYENYFSVNEKTVISQLYQILGKYISSKDIDDNNGHSGLKVETIHYVFDRKGSHYHNWFWWELSKSSSLPWSIELVQKFEDKWFWARLSSNESLPWSIEFIEKFKDKWDWARLASNESLPWSIEFVENYKDKWHGIYLIGIPHRYMNGFIPVK